jgi:hypothetical protein
LVLVLVLCDVCDGSSMVTLLWADADLGLAVAPESLPDSMAGADAHADTSTDQKRPANRQTNSYNILLVPQLLSASIEQ